MRGAESAVFATTTTTELFFRQAVGRVVRWTRGVPRQKAYFFLPDDPRLRHYAATLSEQRRHSLRRFQPPLNHGSRRSATQAIPCRRFSHKPSR